MFCVEFNWRASVWVAVVFVDGRKRRSSAREDEPFHSENGREWQARVVSREMGE